jgi:Glycosyl transferase family 2
MALRLPEPGTLPLVSVIITAYNYERFLARTIDSALDQAYPADRLEIVIVDDGSTDSTPALLADYAACHPAQIRVFRQENAGFVAATNRAFSEARGEFWALLDADDLWPPDKTMRQVELFARNPRLGLAYADMEIIDADDHVVSPSFWAKAQLAPPRGPGALAPLLVGENVAAASSIMVRAALRERFAPIPEGVPFPDWWLMTQVAAVAEVDYLDDLRMGYRLHGANMGHGATGRQLMGDSIRHSMARRGAAALPADALMPAWLEVERAGMAAVRAAGSAFVPLPQPSVDDLAAAARAASRARVLAARGAQASALRAWVVAAAHDPFDQEAREAIATLGPAVATGSPGGVDPLAPARSFVALVGAEDLAAEPALLTEFERAFRATDNATLYVHGPGADAQQLSRVLTGAIDASGVDVSHCDVVACPDPDHVVDPESLRKAADVLLSRETDDRLRARYDEIVALESPPRASL